jgi:hypothetical protein
MRKVVLRVVEQDQPPRVHARDLARELGADRPAGAGDQHGLAGQVGAVALEVHADRLAPQDVLDLHLAHLPHDVAAALQQLEDRGQGPDGDPALAAGAHHPRAQRARRGGDRDRHLVGLDVVEHAAEVGAGVAQHLHAVDALPAEARVVVDEPDRVEPEGRVAQDLAQHQPAAVPGPDDEDPPGVLARAEAAQRPLVDRAGDEAGAADEEQRQQEEQREHPGRHADRHLAGARGARRHRLGQRHEPAEGQRGDDHRLPHRDEVALAGVAPPPLVEPEAGEDHQAHHDDPADRRREQLLVAVRDAGVEAQPVGEEVGDRDEDPVDRELGERVAVQREGGRAQAPAHDRRL